MLRSTSKTILQLSVLICCLLSCQTAHAEGFPGIGDRGQYAEALPHYNLGNRYLSKEWYEKAVEKYNDAIAIYPFDADVYTNLAIALRKLGRTAEAEGACRKALELKPDDWMAWSNLANLLMIQDRYPEAYHYFKGALKCNLPSEERAAIQSNIEGMTKIMKAKGLALDGSSLSPDAIPVDSPGTSHSKKHKAMHSVSSSASHQKVASKTFTTHAKEQAVSPKAGTASGDVDMHAYSQWLGSP